MQSNMIYNSLSTDQLHRHSTEKDCGCMVYYMKCLCTENHDINVESWYNKINIIPWFGAVCQSNLDVAY